MQQSKNFGFLEYMQNYDMRLVTLIQIVKIGIIDIIDD